MPLWVQPQNAAQGFPWMEGHGHSYLTGVFTNGNQDLFANKLARTLDADLIFRGANGVTLTKTGSTPPGESVDYGSVWWLLRNFTAGNTPEYVARGGILAILTGLNDLNLTGGPPAYPVSGNKRLLRTYINYWRLCALWDDANAVWTRGSQWTQQAGTDRNVGTGYTMSTVSTLPTGNVGFTLPSNSRGGFIVIGGVGTDTNGGGEGILFDVYIDGVLQPNQFDLRGHDQTGAPGNRHVHDVWRSRTPVSAGTKVVAIDPVTLQGSAFNGGYLDWGGLDDPALAPNVLVIEQPRLPAGGYAAHGGGTARYGDSDVDAWNTAQQEVCAEFPPGEVLYVSLPLMHSDATYFHTDLLHPNVKGHSYIAERCREVIEAAGIRTKYRQLYPAEGLRAGQSVLSGAAGNTTAAWRVPVLDHRDVLRGYLKLFTT